jgi:hypothetical protein
MGVASKLPLSGSHAGRTTMSCMKSHSLTIRLEADLERELEAAWRRNRPLPGRDRARCAAKAVAADAL